MSSIHRSFYYMSILASKCRSAKHFHFPPSSGASFKITLWGRKCRKYLTWKVKNLKWICHVHDPVHELLSLPFISTKIFLWYFLDNCCHSKSRDLKKIMQSSSGYDVNFELVNIFNMQLRSYCCACSNKFKLWVHAQLLLF